jgi:hypothetical protein
MEPGITGRDSAIRFAEEEGHFVIADLLRGNTGGVEGDSFFTDWIDPLDI